MHSLEEWDRRLTKALASLEKIERWEQRLLPAYEAEFAQARKDATRAQVVLRRRIKHLRRKLRRFRTDLGTTKRKCNQLLVHIKTGDMLLAGPADLEAFRAAMRRRAVRARVKRYRDKQRQQGQPIG